MTRLRRFSLPPMGNLPCVLYCNFDLFWAGEQLQVCRLAALDGRPAAARAVRGDGHAAAADGRPHRQVGDVRDGGADAEGSSILAEWRPDTTGEFVVVIEHLLMAIDRVQAAVDAIIPWNDLDGAVRLRPTN